MGAGAVGIFSRQLVGTMGLPRAVSHVAHDHADGLIEVNRALPGLLGAAATETVLASLVN